MSMLSSYIHYLIHPFESHELLKSSDSQGLRHLSLSESLGLSWIFVVINGAMRILLINFVVLLYINLSNSESITSTIFQIDDGFLGFYFIILSTILDVVFYPLFMLFFVQLWEFILRIFGYFLSIEDTDQRVRNVMSVAMSSQILTVIPIFGGIAQKFASLILIFAGVKKQFNASTALTLCILSFPALVSLGLLSLFVFLYILSLS